MLRTIHARATWGRILAVICVAVMSVACSVDASSRGSGAARWAELPRTIGCAVDRSDGGADPDPPLSGQIERVTLRHDGGDRLSLALDFRDGVPEESQAVTGPFSEIQGAPGSLSYSILVLPLGRGEDSVLQVSSPEPAVGKGWEASIILDKGTGGSDRQVPSVTTTGRTLTIVVNLAAAEDQFLDNGRFKANVDVTMMVRGVSPLPTDPDGSYFDKTQECDWDKVLTSSSSSTAPPSPPSPQSPVAARPGSLPTLVDYIRENGLVETPVKRGDPGSPTLNLPIPPGWEDAGARAPQWAFGAIVVSDPAAGTEPPTVTAVFSKLTGDVDPARILQLAPNEIRNLPGYDGPSNGKMSTLGGFDAVQIGGSYLKDDKRWLVAQKTVVIPGRNGAFVLQLNAEAPDGQASILNDATSVIDDKTTIALP